MVALNRTRVDFLEKFQELIDEYNAGSANVEAIYEQLLKFAQKLNEEEQRHVKEKLTEEELAIFDILTKPRVDITRQGRARGQEGRQGHAPDAEGREAGAGLAEAAAVTGDGAAVHRGILGQAAAGVYAGLYRAKCEAVYQHVYDSYGGTEQRLYAQAGGAGAS